MRSFRHTVAGEVCEIYVPEHDDDLDVVDRFLAQGHQFLSCDTESTGLDSFTPQHQLRLVQIGTRDTAWVLRADRFADYIRSVFRRPRNWIMHNAPFDCLVLDRHLKIPVEELLPRTWDTRLVAHLADPRGRDEGGIGLGLKELAKVHVDPLATDGEEELTRAFNAAKWTKKTGWARISIDHAAYLIYAGNDVLITSRLFEKLQSVAKQYPEICKFEHKLQYYTTLMQRKGVLVDTRYVEHLVIDLYNIYVEYCDIAADLGVENVNSTDQVIKHLQEMGENLTALTKKGKLQVDRAVLEPLADLDRQFNRIGGREPNPLADAVLRAKRANKWSESYALAFQELRDADDRIHPKINSLQARTARMSISQPPLQQLPSSDWRIRRALLPDPGFLMFACDYKAIEMRVLAALSEEWTMRNAIAHGLDLHSFTAERVFPEFTVALYEAGDKRANQQRKIAKNIGFGKVYGGGAASVARLTGAEEDGVRVAMKAYDRTFPGIRRYSQQLIRQAKSGLMEVVTPIGRRLPLDADRLYACVNYMVQSTARDIFAKAIIRAFDAGLGDYLLLPVHDELIGQAPEKEAKDVAEELGRVMATTFMGVEIASNPSVVGKSWGAAYRAPDVLPLDLPVRKERKLRAGQWAQDSLDLGI